MAAAAAWYRIACRWPCEKRKAPTALPAGQRKTKMKSSEKVISAKASILEAGSYLEEKMALFVKREERRAHAFREIALEEEN